MATTDCQCVASNLLSLVERDGPVVLGTVLGLLAPSVPVAALLALATAVGSLIQAKTREEQLRDAEQAILAEDRAETELLMRK